MDWKFKVIFLRFYVELLKNYYASLNYPTFSCGYKRGDCSTIDFREIFMNRVGSTDTGWKCEKCQRYDTGDPKTKMEWKLECVKTEWRMCDRLSWMTGCYECCVWACKCLCLLLSRSWSLSPSLFRSLAHCVCFNPMSLHLNSKSVCIMLGCIVQRYRF